MPSLITYPMACSLNVDNPAYSIGLGSASRHSPLHSSSWVSRHVVATAVMARQPLMQAIPTFRFNYAVPATKTIGLAASEFFQMIASQG